MPIHEQPFEGAGRTYTLRSGAEIRIEDWWDRVAGQSWTVSNGSMAALNYGMRAAMDGLPLDDEVVYGKDSEDLGHLVHVTELVGKAGS